MRYASTMSGLVVAADEAKAVTSLQRIRTKS